MQKTKTQKGITLVALIVTIIVMLILVAVTLVITLGENGIIAKARTASQKSNARQNAEKDTFSSDSTGTNINAVVEGTGKWNINTGDKDSGSIKYGTPYVRNELYYDVGQHEYVTYGYVFYSNGTGKHFDIALNEDYSVKEFHCYSLTYEESSVDEIMNDEEFEDVYEDFISGIYMDGIVKKLDDEEEGTWYAVFDKSFETVNVGEDILSSVGVRDEIVQYVKTLED